MRLKEMYELAVETAMRADIRTREDLESDLQRAKERYDKLEPREKERFDVDALWNPYADTRILYGEGDTEVTSVLWGIDITTGEVLLADRLRERGRKVDALISHHPRGKALAAMYDVMHIQEAMMHQMGIPINVAECILAPRVREVQCGIHSSNHNQVVDACRLLGIPLMCIHSAADNLVQRYLQDLFDQKEPRRIRDVLNILSSIPEYDAAIRDHAGPEVFVGDKERKAGKILVKMSGGTAGPKEMYEELSKAGVGTFICMHLPEPHVEEARKHHLNVIVASHMASDSLGTNLLADKFEERGVAIIPCSGYIRVARK
jgi:putative NIF3 family GTP cyclohydrolase 1 type 2